MVFLSHPKVPVVHASAFWRLVRRVQITGRLPRLSGCSEEAIRYHLFPLWATQPSSSWGVYWWAHISLDRTWRKPSFASAVTVYSLESRHFAYVDEGDQVLHIWSGFLIIGRHTLFSQTCLKQKTNVGTEGSYERHFFVCFYILKGCFYSLLTIHHTFSICVSPEGPSTEKSCCFLLSQGAL